MAASGTAMHARRCVLHAQREAAARCPGCKRFYCRECITEHDGKVLCSGCLTENTRERSEKKQGSGHFKMTAGLIGTFLVLLLIFFSMGVLIQILPEKIDINIDFEEPNEP